MEFHHISVLLNEAVEGLAIRPEGIYVDCTVGGGGHSYEIAKRLTTGRLIGIDQDEAALAAAKEHLAPFSEKVTLVHSNFSAVDQVLDDLQITKVHGFLMDLGVSSYQLDTAERGFSYMQDAPLDMRMDPEQKFSAYDVVNTYSEEDLCRIISQYGEERWAKRIAQFIVAQRPIETTFGLVEAIKKAVPKGARKDGPHPAKRTFQAIRIEVNGELSILEDAIGAMTKRLYVGGRLAVITFHSLEDRIVKNAFRAQEHPCTCPPEFPVCVCGKRPLAKVITRKPILPSAQELEINHRARSAKLRILERIDEAGRE